MLRVPGVNDDGKLSCSLSPQGLLVWIRFQESGTLLPVDSITRLSMPSSATDPFLTPPPKGKGGKKSKKTKQSGNLSPGRAKAVDLVSCILMCMLSFA
jgi:hypothetical protein